MSITTVPMQINLTKEQYKQLIEMIAMSRGIVGILNDALPNGGYKTKSKNMDALENYLVQHAKDFGCGELAQEFEGETVLDDDYYSDKIQPTLSDYEDFVMHSTLPKELAWRDFRRDHTQKEIDAMAKKNSGYFGVVLYDYEKRYWDEFEKHEFNRLEVVEENAEKEIIRVLGEVGKEV